MDKNINWLHFSDLHYGQKGQNILLPKIKKELFADIEYIKNELGKIDVVFFSGDLAQSGGQEEFNELSAFLKELWLHFKKLGSEPYLIAIPGNHDLQRPDQTKAVVKVLKNYHNDEELRENFWTGIKAQNENYDLINNCFRNYCKWYQQIDIPKPDLRAGLLPGDISADLSINGLSMKIVGLNSAFLELSNADYSKKLAINPEQIIALTSGSPLEWLAQSDVALLMTHHDPSWYDSETTSYYQNDINPPDAFHSHLCGHMHEPNVSEARLLGSSSRRIQIAPSMFGLQKINETIDRVHGYYAGRYNIIDNQIRERFYPRRANKRYDGNYGITADNGFDLANRNYLENAFPTRSTSIECKPDESIIIKVDSITTMSDENILNMDKQADNAKELERIPKINYASLPHHKTVRLVEQKNFTRLMNDNRYVWLITDWGLNEAGFIGSVSSELQVEKAKGGFLLNCEDIVNDQELFSAFQEQFGIALQRFCNITSNVENTFLILDHVNATLYSTYGSYIRF